MCSIVLHHDVQTIHIAQIFPIPITNRLFFGTQKKETSKHTKGPKAFQSHCPQNASKLEDLLRTLYGLETLKLVLCILNINMQVV